MAESKSTAIDGFTLYLQFLNRRREQVILSDFSARYYDGKNYLDMYFAGNTIPPALCIASKSPLDVKIELNITEKFMDVPFFAINKKVAHLNQEYKVNKEKRFVTIDDIETDGPESPYTWIAF